MPLRGTRTFDSERPEVHAVLENDDVGGDDVMRKKKGKMDSKSDRNVSNLPEKPKSPISSSFPGWLSASSSVAFFNLVKQK